MYKLTPEGKEYLEKGLPERQLLNFLKKEKRTLEEVSKLPKSVIALGWAKKSGWVDIKDGVIALTEAGLESIYSKTAEEKALLEIEKGKVVDESIIKVLLSRNLVEEFKEIPKEKKPSLFGKLFKKKEKELVVNEIAQLTPELIKTGEWKKLPFRKYDVHAPAPTTYPGKKQPYIQFIEDIRERLIGLGFQEMLGPLVETNFWNMDALFMPQDHPGRSIHDVLMLKKPKLGNLPDKNLVSRVKATHEGGWVTESSGWGGYWDETEASKLLMRSHTTSVSARTLFEHGDKPGKYFTIARNYRYDVIDATHLIEFFQCEGIVIGENLTFRHLLGYLTDLAKAIGCKEIKFKPGYFPFTEPSVEGYVKHPTMGWFEVLPAGLLRPEVLRPLGLEKSQVLAWGIGIDRLAMIKLGIEDIRMLFSDDLSWMRKVPMVR